MKRKKGRDNSMVEMQMGPMIDMVFLLLVFFIVTSKPIRQEADVSLSLPGLLSQAEAFETPDETKIHIGPEGGISINEVPMDLRTLEQRLRLFKQSAKANQTVAMVTVEAHDRALHQRIVDVLNTCAQSGIADVTFSDDPSTEGGGS